MKCLKLRNNENYYKIITMPPSNIPFLSGLSPLLALLISFYLLGVLMTFIMGIIGISNHITLKGLLATFIMSLFSFFAIIYMVLGNDSKNYKNF